MGGGASTSVKGNKLGETEEERESEGAAMDREQSLSISIHLMPIFFVPNAECTECCLNAVRDR